MKEIKCLVKALDGRRDDRGGYVQCFEMDYFDNEEKIKELNKLYNEGCLCELSIRKHGAKRSLDANSYFWVLCSEIAGAIRSDKDTVYLMQLRKYGSWVDVDIPAEAYETLKRGYRLTERVREYELHKAGVKHAEKRLVARCYIGSSNYDTAEMSKLINGTAEDAKDLGIDTWTKYEITAALAVWENR